MRSTRAKGLDRSRRCHTPANNLSHAIEAGCKKLYSLSVGSSSGVELRSRLRCWRVDVDGEAPLRERSSLSQCRPGRSNLLRAGPRTATRSSYACVRSVSAIRLLGTGIAASRRMMSITIGSGFAGAAVSVAEGSSPFFRCFLFRTGRNILSRRKLQIRQHCPVVDAGLGRLFARSG